MCAVTFLCGGDLPGVSVDLEQGGVVLVGNLTSQTVLQLSVGGRCVVLVQCNNLCESGTWETEGRRGEEGEGEGAKQVV